MTAFTPVWHFALSALAVWRLAHLFARENGPWNSIAHLRATAGNGLPGRLMDCFCGLSFLFSLLPALWMSGSWMVFLAQWLALSAVALLLERIVPRPQSGLRIHTVSTTYLDKVIRGV
jgi:hypothetical protein